MSATVFGSVDEQLCMTYEASECDAAGDYSGPQDVHVLSRERNQNAAASIVSPTCRRQLGTIDVNSVTSGCLL